MSALVLLHLVASEAAAVRLTGIFVYSTDDLGNPNGYESFPGNIFQAQAWRSIVEPRKFWYGLGLLPGTPPENLEEPFLNAADFTVDVDLRVGESQFTIMVEPGPLTETDAFERWALNLYFDGNHDAPGIAVLVPRYGDPNGSPPTPSQANADQVYSFDIRPVDAPAPFFYEDERVRVTVVGFSLLPPQLAGVAIDRLQPYRLASGGFADFVGVLTLRVEDTSGSSGGGCALSEVDSADSVGWLCLLIPAVLMLLNDPRRFGAGTISHLTV